MMTPNAVTRGLVPRVYPMMRPGGAVAPRPVDARVEHAHDEGSGGYDEVMTLGPVTRGLVPRVYPMMRPDGAAAPRPVDARVKHAHDDKSIERRIEVGVAP